MRPIQAGIKWTIRGTRGYQNQASAGCRRPRPIKYRTMSSPFYYTLRMSQTYPKRVVFEVLVLIHVPDVQVLVPNVLVRINMDSCRSRASLSPDDHENEADVLKEYNYVLLTQTIRSITVYRIRGFYRFYRPGFITV